MAEVVWTDRALADLARAVAYVSEFRPLAAQRLAQRLRSAADSLEAEPARGRTIARGRRELVVIAPYLIRYRLEGDVVKVLEVRHGARRR